MFRFKLVEETNNVGMVDSAEYSTFALCNGETCFVLFNCFDGASSSRWKMKGFTDFALGAFSQCLYDFVIFPLFHFLYVVV